MPNLSVSFTPVLPAKTSALPRFGHTGPKRPTPSQPNRPAPQVALHRNHFASQIAQVRFGGAIEANIPVADMTDFTSGDPARVKRFVETIGNGLRDVGFIALKNHGVNPQLFKDHYAALERVFKQVPKNDLMALALIKKQGIERGYLPPGELKPHRKPDGSVEYKPDMKENWITGPDNNVYPSQVPEFARLNQQLFKGMEQVGMKLVEALAIYLDDKNGVLRAMVTDANGNCTGTNIMRSIHYPKSPPEELAKIKPGDQVVRAGEHRDISFFTLLPQATEAGLELQRKDGSWMPVFAQEGMIIVNAGDSLKYLTEGMVNAKGESRAIMSTKHRVMGDHTSGTKDRYSTPFFFNMNLRGPIRRIDTGQILHVVDPEKKIDVTLDEGLKLLYARFRASNTIGQDVTYAQFKEGYKDLGPSIQQAVKENGAKAIIV